MNTVQSLFATLLGYLYTLRTRTPTTPLPIFPSRAILWPLLLVALTSALASPFGYAALAHVDYITFILAKSCKLLPVMFLHVTLYGKRYPFYKYAVVALVTSGVAVFTLHSKSGSKKGGGGGGGSSAYGLMLLSINLLFDGLTNSTQDDIYARFRPYTGQQMMCALNLFATGLTTVYLLLQPFIAQTGLGSYVGMGETGGQGELVEAWEFVTRFPAVGWDVLGFAATGALGQVFICKLTSFNAPLLLPYFLFARSGDGQSEAAVGNGSMAWADLSRPGCAGYTVEYWESHGPILAFCLAYKRDPEPDGEVDDAKLGRLGSLFATALVWVTFIHDSII